MRPRTKIIALGVTLVVAAVAYTGVWFYFAGKLESRASAFVAALTGQGIDAACTNLDVGGYPFEMGLSCDSVTATDERYGSFEAGAMHSVAQIGQPNHIVSTLDGPMKATGADGTSIAADWSSFGTSTVFGSVGLLRGDVQAKAFKATVKSPELPAPVDITSPELEAHTRRNGADLDAAFTVNRLAVKGSGPLAGLPASDISGVATLDGMAQLLSGRQPVPEHLLRGTSGTLRTLTADIGKGATVSVSGPFSFDAKGRLSGTFDVKLANLEAWQAAARSILPGIDQTVESAGTMLAALGGGDGQISVTLSADHGRLSLGFIPLGKLPPI